MTINLTGLSNISLIERAATCPDDDSNYKLRVRVLQPNISIRRDEWTLPLPFVCQNLTDIMLAMAYYIEDWVKTHGENPHRVDEIPAVIISAYESENESDYASPIMELRI